MPVQANILANMQQLSLPDIYQASETTKYLRVRNELLGYHAAEESEIAKRREKRREIQEMYTSMPARIAEYERLGMLEEAAQTKEALLAGHRQEVGMFEIVSASVDALPPEERPGAWLKMREQALNAGMFEPYQMPDRYADGGQDWIDSWLKKVKGDLKNLEITYGEPQSEQFPEGRTMTQEALQQGGEIVTDVPPYESSADRRAREGTGDGGKPWQVTSGDTGQIKALAAEQFETILDQNGNFMGLRGEDKRKALQLTERASEIYNAGRGQVTHGKAVAQAAREQGLPVKSTSDPNALNPLDLQQ